MPFTDAASHGSPALDDLLSDAARRETLGANARRVVEANRGALDRTVEIVISTLARHGIE